MPLGAAGRRGGREGGIPPDQVSNFIPGAGFCFEGIKDRFKDNEIYPLGFPSGDPVESRSAHPPG